MIESSRKNLESLGMADKFELICADVFDENFKLPEKVDCVVLSYTISTFINNYEMLKTLLSQCEKQVKENGYMLVADFCYLDMPCENFWGGMYTENPKAPAEI